MALPPAVIYWVDEAADIQIRGGICSCRFTSGETVIEVRARIPTLLKSIGNGTLAFANWEAEASGRFIRQFPADKEAKPLGGDDHAASRR